jgi:hypothetical protein
VESDGLVVAGEGVSQAIKPRQATKASKNKFFIKSFLVFNNECTLSYSITLPTRGYRQVWTVFSGVQTFVVILLRSGD